MSLVQALVQEGLFNTKPRASRLPSERPASTTNLVREQGVSIYITGLPINLHSGIQPLDEVENAEFDGDTRHFLTDSHPLHINEPTMYWNAPLKELIWNPPRYNGNQWIGSWAFPM